MISGTFTGEGRYSQPIYCPRGQNILYQIAESSATWAAHVTEQWIMDDSDPSVPGVNDERWTTMDDGGYDMIGATPVTKTSGTGGFWFRLAILTGDYISGEAEYKIKTVGW